MMSTGTAPDVFGAAFLACAVEAIAATTMALDAGTARNSRSAGLGASAALKRRVCRRDSDVDVADLYSLDADMVPV